ncbi:MAG: ASCH domain-containing protein [Leucobacter sp.]
MATPSSSLPALELVPPGDLRDRLNEQVLSGVKTATSRLVVMDAMAGIDPEPVGTRMALLGSDGEQLAVVEITRVFIAPFGTIGAEVSAAEGEWMVDPADWRAAHTRYWTAQIPAIRSHLLDEGWELTEETPVIVRFFCHIKEDE